MCRSFFIILLFLSFSSIAQQKVIFVTDKVISISGRKFEINADGFPKQIQSYYDSDLKAFGDKSTNLLYEPIHFHLFTSSKIQEKLVANTFNVLSENKNFISWDATSSSANMLQHVQGVITVDGIAKFHVELKALNDINFSNINFHIPFEKNASKYLVGLGNDRDIRPDTVKWSWKMVDKVKPEVLIGNDNAALFLSFDQHKSVDSQHIRNGWTNENKDVLQINIKGSSMLTDFSTGLVKCKKGEILVFDFMILVSPMNIRDGRKKLEKRFNAYKREVMNSHLLSKKGKP
ncbi:hypothetical protein ASE92_02690 [Pedobacter sp. Leaf41]|uniref:glycoside hydrolase domain-containing protein n=1 Tax=Pedobacter sp. Leaf41 TaxID=1736218 RepID=UPI0007031B61|nr:glycoside hydrolase domain-containing protein [Pedobacter sp. Leaf41]KQN38359.1 hypothetical protein ASE92_02690 [Pedobacter sp. Leaf41]